MPSSPTYKRNYTEEYKTAKARGEVDGGHDGENAKRKRLRRAMLKKGLVKKGQDADHITPLSKGGSNTISNGRARSEHDNRSFPRNSKGGLVKNVPKT